jgi:hypothetical protein
MRLDSYIRQVLNLILPLNVLSVEYTVHVIMFDCNERLRLLSTVRRAAVKI